MNQLTVAACAASISLCGCSTTGANHQVDDLERSVRRTEVTVDAPLSVASCVERNLASRGDPAQLVFLLYDFNNSSASPTAQVVAGHAPQDNFRAVVKSAIQDLGFSVSFDPKLTHSVPKSGAYIIEGALTQFTPLTETRAYRDDLDLIAPSGSRGKTVAAGKVSVSATLYGAVNGTWQSWKSTSVSTSFWQIKNEKKLNIAFPMAVSAGRGFETLQVHSVQEAAQQSVRFAIAQLISKAFQLQC